MPLNWSLQKHIFLILSSTRVLIKELPENFNQINLKVKKKKKLSVFYAFYVLVFYFMFVAQHVDNENLNVIKIGIRTKNTSNW